MKPLKYENDDYEILVQNHVFIKDKKAKNYYRNDISSLNKSMRECLIEYHEKISDRTFIIYIAFMLVMIIANYIHLLYLQRVLIPDANNISIVIIVVYFVFNIILHEIGHIYSLKYFGRSYDKLGVKLNFYVFPAFYVQMNETYMLSKNDKIIVHSFGLFINFTLINVFQLLNMLFINNYTLSLSYLLFSSTMIWNIVPILNSDGYKIMLAFLSLDEFSNITKNHWIVILFQIIGLSIAINTLIHWIIFWGKYFGL
ncbi:peptidase [Staphylococcus americanisciuri]|uniref:Peptidase n=1 Tax=Staphylococcus americanisciuri TaxID=2973940 RepID=A0ABT2EZX9_9STAP|nr:peptidase [Staphylococcus americanisciuri]MCS4485591.1 peptidase [Staphylococcus americanisciuri]